jgi:NAD(P)-dependent dehydrogenase (short-subunit alcohol dehydrogenase family)
MDSSSLFVSRYGQSKLANVLFGQELAERVKGKNILVNAIHPGGVDTQLGRHIMDAIATVSQTLADAFKKSAAAFSWHPRDAALTQLYAAVGPSLKAKKITGMYYHPIARLTDPDLHAQGERGKKLRKHLWTLTEKFIAEH